MPLSFKLACFLGAGLTIIYSMGVAGHNSDPGDGAEQHRDRLQLEYIMIPLPSLLLTPSFLTIHICDGPLHDRGLAMPYRVVLNLGAEYGEIDAGFITASESDR